MRGYKGFPAEALILILLLTLLPVVAQGQTKTDVKVLSPTADAEVYENSPNSNNGRYSFLAAREGIGDERMSFLMFDVGEIPGGSTALDARLKLFINSIDTLYPNPTVGVHYCPSNDWTEDGITYNNMPAFDATPLDTVNVTTEWKPYRWNVTSAAQTALNAHDRRLSLVVKAETNGSVSFASRQALELTPPEPDVHPLLTVSYEAPPSSGIDPVITGVVIIVAAGAVAITGIVLLSRMRKQKEKSRPKSK